MIYVIAWFCPPLALLLDLRPISALINGCFWLLGIVLTSFAGIGLLLIIPCIIHACSCISRDHANSNTQATIKELKSLKKEIRR